MVDPLTRFWLNLHGGARAIDADQALLGALGVAAFAYPHQLDNVVRMATDTACRWLLADEVGLGKTVQALMLLRALGAQRKSGIRVALITPDDLVQQWQEELICRTHVGASGIALEPSDDSSPPPPVRGEIVVDLCRPARLAAGAVRLTAKLYDLLIVDEYPKLSQQVRELVGTASRTIPHILLLSATPAMHDQQTRRDVLEILEPDASRQASALGMDLLEMLKAREDEALAYLRGETAEPDGLEAEPGQARQFYRDTHGLFRRVIRTRRVDYPDALPQRRYRSVVVAPTDGDVERVAAVRNYLTSAASEGLNVRQDLLLQIALRSPPSLLNRASTLRRQSPKLVEPLRRLSEAARDPGDAKLDALIDHLRRIFFAVPAARVLVVAEDNRTVDYLAGAIEKLVDVTVARKRRAYGDAMVELDVHVAQLRDELEDFENGRASVLVAADVAAEGHNLQFAAEIIFYVLPWDPRAVDQWIGRLDRLGGKGPPAKRTINITAIVTENSIEARILEVYEAAEIFTGGRVFDEDSWRKLADAIDMAAYGTGVDWKGLAEAARDEVALEEGWRSYSQFEVPDRATGARERFAALRSRRYAVPFEHNDLGNRQNWFREREIAAKRLLSIADELDVLELRRKTDPETNQRYRSLWYPRCPQPDDIAVPELDATHAGHQAALILYRSDLKSPPNANVGTRRLHFFDQGDPLHDSVVRTFAALKPPNSSEVEYVVRFPDGHPGQAYRGDKIVIVTGMLRPAPGLPFSSELLERHTTQGDTVPEREALQAAIRRSYEEYLADCRWFIELAPPEYYVFAARLHASNAEIVDPGLFIGTVDGVDLPRRVTHQVMNTAEIEQVRATRDALRQRMVERGRADVAERTARLTEASGARRFKAAVEAQDAIAAAVAVEQAGAQRGGELGFDRARRRANELAVQLARIFREMRLNRLDQMPASLARSPVTEPRCCVLAVH
jgi:ATP-dependent helicase HepA